MSRIECLVLILFLAICSVKCLPLNDATDGLKCDYSKCPKIDPNRLNVHLMPHTHDDVGWLKTVDQYYYGSRSNIQKAGVQYILDSVVQALLANENRRFIYVETAFFWKWWTQQDDVIKQAVKELVYNGRLEFINGGWSMNDEAGTHYNSIIDQMTWGLRRLKDEFGACGVPKVAWQIDPFGHSKEQASLFAQMNFDGLFFARMDYQDMQSRIENKSLEMVWKASEDLGKCSDLFTGMMQMGYGPVQQYCWDLVGCNDDPIVDNPESEEYNVDARVDGFISYAESYSQLYSTNNLLFPEGTDFQYQAAHPWFKNMDKLIKYVNAKQINGSKVNVFYSTPSCYLYSLYLSNQTFETKSDDFFPYASDDHSYWTGYFTSRPALKRYERVGNNILQVCKQIDVLAQLSQPYDEDIIRLREAMGILQHHDAVAGTEKQHVANNYALKLAQGVEKCKHVINEAYNKLLPKSSKTAPIQLYCDALNISACDITERSAPVAATFYNPIGRSVTQFVRLPIGTKGTYQVLDPSGKNVTAVLSPIPDEVLRIPGRESNATYELVFQVEIPALGFATYLIKQISSDVSPKLSVESKITASLSVKAKSFSAMFDANGALNAIKRENGQVIKIEQELDYYKAMAGDNKGSDSRASGAYIFRPDGQTPVRVNPTKNLFAKLVENELSVEVHQIWDSWITQVVRVYKEQDFIEFDWVVGPISIEDKIGKEVILRFNTNLTTDGVFYTDANGRQVLKRVHDYRPTWNYTVTEPVSGNYYPINSRIYIRDEKTRTQLTILNDRSQGGGSVVNGSAGTVELMVHRRLLYDDYFGVDEALNETAYGELGLVVRGRHWLLVDTIEESAKKHRDMAQRIFLEPLVTFANYVSESEYYANFQTSYSSLVNALPPNVHLLTLEPWNGGNYLLRLEHFYQSSDDPVLSKPVTVDIKNLFKAFQIVEATEMTLAANHLLSTAKRLEFKTRGTITEPNLQCSKALDPQDFNVTLNPMQIRTFVVKLAPKTV